MIDRLARLVAIPSVSREECAIADAVALELRRAGLPVQRQGNNVWCEIGDEPLPRLLLNSHLDTVPAGAGWSGEPCRLREIGGRLIGLGANDAKGCVVALLEAAFALKKSLDSGERFGGTVVLALTAEEENSGEGLESILERLKPLDAALVGEPTGLTPMIAQRGLLILKGTARGRNGHPANTPADSPDNAIYRAASDLVRLADFDWGPEHPMLGRCHAHATMINGGTARNVVPDTCEFYLDVRTTPLETHAQLHARLARHFESELEVESDRLVPVETCGEDAIVRAVLLALPGASPCGSRTMSDMAYLKDIPCVKIGPGESPRSHTPDEYVLPEELRAGAAAYVRIVRGYFNSTDGSRRR